MGYKEQEQVIELFHEFINKLVGLIEAKDQCLKGHCARVARYANIMATAMKLSPEHIQEVYTAALLHDVGYIVIREPILAKAGNLSAQELDLIREHPVSGQSILAQLHLSQNILRYVKYHHEFFNGRGYPDGISGDKIPLGARIVALAEAFDAMTSSRSYRKAFTMEQALEEIFLQADKQFDPGLVNLFVELMERERKHHDQRQVSNTDARKKQILENIVQEIIAAFQKGELSFPVLPQVLQHIQKVLLDPNISLENAASAIRGDIKISTSLISLANSPYYKGVSKIESVEQAIARLGFKETSKLTSLIANRSLYICNEKRYKVLMFEYWKHSLACAYITHFLARQLHLGDTDEYFTMGLVHDVGKGLLLNAITRVIENRNLSHEFEDSEIREVINKMHCSFGAALLKRWGFSDRYIYITKHHETTSGDNNAPLAVKVIQLANLLTRELDCRPTCHDGEDAVIADIASNLSLSLQAVDLVIQRTKEIVTEVIKNI
jgi:putative nucleotidyltransferase with HDIG domain